MELKSTQFGRHLAQHPYNKVKLLNAGLEVSGPKHQMVIPFNQVIDVSCKRGIIWGELEFELSNDKVIRLHGTPWEQTQLFHQAFNEKWSAWGDEMSDIAYEQLVKQESAITRFIEHKRALDPNDLQHIQTDIQKTFSILPLPQKRLAVFENCQPIYDELMSWLNEGEKRVDDINQYWIDVSLQQYASLFDNLEEQPLNLEQRKATISSAKSTLTVAGAGCGKTSVLLARVAWLLESQQAQDKQILLLAFNNRAADEMRQRVKKRLPSAQVDVKTFHALALDIIQAANKNKSVLLTPLETNSELRQAFWLKNWQALCEEKASYAKGWQKWLIDAFGWSFSKDEIIWQDGALIKWLSPKLDTWLSILKSQSLNQTEIIELASPEQQDEFKKSLRLLLPLIKCWKSELKGKGETDFAGLIQQATLLIQKNKFQSPWLHILVDEFQDTSPQQLMLLHALRDQVKGCAVFAVGDDWQSIYRFSGAELQLTTAFEKHFEHAKQFILQETYRFNQSIADVSNQFILQNPLQIRKALVSHKSDKQASVTILPQEQLENLLDKLSGFVKENETVFLLGRYNYMKPEFYQNASIRWPKLNLEFMTIHSSKGLQADYVIILGLQDGVQGFPAEAEETLIEEILLPQLDDYPYAEERRLLYVAMTRAKKKVWLLEDKQSPSIFIEQLKKSGAVSKRKA